MIFDPAEFWPGGALARELGVGAFGKDGEVARVFVAENRDGFGQGIREDAELGHDMHSVEGFAFR